MRRIGRLGLAVLFATLAACAGGSKEKVQTNPGGGDTGKDQKEEALPDQNPSDMRMTLLTELSRSHRSVEILKDMPEKRGADGCIKYAPQSGHDVFLAADYHDCHWNRRAPDGKEKVHFQFATGRELFSNFERASNPYRKAEAQFELRMTRLKSPPVSAGRFEHKRALVLSLTPVNGSYGYDSIISFGRETAKTEFWQANLHGFWRFAEGKTLSPGAVLDIQYRGKTSAGKTSTRAETRLVSTSEVKFAGPCRRPIGDFDWHHKEGSTVTVGKIHTDTTGVVDLRAPDEKTPWPNPCLESDTPVSF